jgi:hypothetical protein
MVRPVEPDPPEALRRVDLRVKRANAAPDKLGYQHVSERQDRQRHGADRERPAPFPGDSVEIEHGSDATQPEEAPAPEPPPERDAGPEHIDLKG